MTNDVWRNICGRHTTNFVICFHFRQNAVNYAVGLAMAFRNLSLIMQLAVRAVDLGALGVVPLVDPPRVDAGRLGRHDARQRDGLWGGPARALWAPNWRTTQVRRKFPFGV